MASASVVPICTFSVHRHVLVSTHFSSDNLNPRLGQGRSVTRCCHKRVGERARTERNYYELLGVSVDSNVKEIKEAYRKLQKKFHPDVAGKEGHDYTLMLNEAYKVLMREDLRKEYDVSTGQATLRFRRNNSELHHSSWRGRLRPLALFVDENACIGCRECVHHARNTFVMDEALGCARVTVQYGDEDQNIEVSVDSCPVNCIHWVDREELPVLEFLIRPRPKEGYGVFGGGWERPENVFAAAKAFSKQLEWDAGAKQHQRRGTWLGPSVAFLFNMFFPIVAPMVILAATARATVHEETPAQAEARSKASMEIKMERLNGVWNSLTAFLGSYLWDRK